MVFPVVGGNKSKGYDVENSLRFDASDSPQLSKDMSSLSATSTKKFTTSFWLKPGNVPQTSYGGIIDVGGDHAISLVSDNTFYFFENGGSDLYWRPTRVFRDPSAWYNIIIIADSTLSTQTDRVKIYVNGVIETSFHNNSGPNQNHDFAFNTNNTRYIGRKQTTSSSLDGYLTEIHHIDGQAKAHTDFGKFNDNGVWVPIKYTGTYGNTGYYLEFKQTGTSQNSSGIGADTSGNDNHFAVSNLAATDVTEDTCTNNFAVCNVLSGKNTSDLTTGNLVLDADSTGDIVAPSTIGFSSGKWYMEMKSTITAGHGNRKTVGVYETDSDINHPRQFTSASPYNGVVVDLRNGSAYESADDGDATDISSFANNDICGLAYDADNGLLYVYKNGTAENSGNAINAGNALDTSKTYAFYIGQDGGGTNNGELFCNFGNPSFAISSGNNDGKYGNFEYAPPSGYYALCTKRLAEFG